jgi:hypothetical protein
MISTALGISMALAGAIAGDASREELSLNGRWEYRLVDDLEAAPPADGFGPCSVPGYLSGIDYRRAWFRRQFSQPGGWKGKRIKIHFGGVKYNSRVYVNGQPVGGCFGGYRPFEVDVPKTNLQRRGSKGGEVSRLALQTIRFCVFRGSFRSMGPFVAWAPGPCSRPRAGGRCCLWLQPRAAPCPSFVCVADLFWLTESRFSGFGGGG